MLDRAQVTTMIPVVDMDRAVDFYANALGLELEETGEPGVVFFHCGGGTRIALYERPTPTKADHTLASWLVDDIEEAVDELDRRGITFEQYNFPGLQTDARGIADTGAARSAWFKDPEGNILAVTEMK